MNINYKWELFQEATFDYRRMCNFYCAQCALKTTLGRKKAGDSNTRNSKQYNNTCVTHRLSAGWDPFWISCDWKPGPNMMEKKQAANRVPQTHWFIMFPLKPYGYPRFQTNPCISRDVWVESFPQFFPRFCHPGETWLRFQSIWHPAAEGPPWNSRHIGLMVWLNLSGRRPSNQASTKSLILTP
jgi:hypothetical protein